MKSVILDEFSQTIYRKPWKTKVDSRSKKIEKSINQKATINTSRTIMNWFQGKPQRSAWNPNLCQNALIYRIYGFNFLFWLFIYFDFLGNEQYFFGRDFMIVAVFNFIYKHFCFFLNCRLSCVTIGILHFWKIVNKTLASSLFRLYFVLFCSCHLTSNWFTLQNILRSNLFNSYF